MDTDENGLEQRKTVKEFGNGAHVTLPSEWIGGTVEIQLSVPDTPPHLTRLTPGTEFTVYIPAENAHLRGKVDETELLEPETENKGWYTYGVHCEYVSPPHQLDTSEYTIDTSRTFTLSDRRKQGQPWKQDIVLGLPVEEHGGISIHDFELYIASE